LSDYAIDQLVEDKEEADFYMDWAAASTHYKAIANWMIGPIRVALHEGLTNFQTLSTTIPFLVELVELVETNQLSFSVASTKVLKEMIAHPGSPKAYASTHNLLQTGSTEEIEKWIDEVLAMHPEKVAEYKKGKKGLLGLFMGEVKKISKGKTDPKMTTSLLEQKLT
jgi:aspartyl-tRNA(Asn)/glutamyl-tRNA(Gln) amidotransferase subunit B